MQKQHYLHTLMKHLVCGDYAMRIFADGEPLRWGENDGWMPSQDTTDLFQQTQEVDDGLIYVYEADRPDSIGWIRFTNWNDEDESLVDYTIGHKGLEEVIEAFMKENNQ